MIAALIINSKISTHILLFLKEIGLRKISPEKVILSGSQHGIRNLYDFERRISNGIGLKNLLPYLKIDRISIESLVNQAFKEKSVKNICEFLYTFEEGLDKEFFFFTEVLETYKNSQNNQEVKDQMENLLNKLYQSRLNDLQNFDIFDIFESSENVKIKTSQIITSSLYQDLLKDIISDSKSDSIKLFLLFEEYLCSAKNRVSLFKNSSLSFLEQLPELNKRFFFAKKNQIDNIFKQNNNLFKKYLQEIKKEQIVYASILIAFTLIKTLGLSERTQYSRKISTYSPPFASIINSASNMSREHFQDSQERPRAQLTHDPSSSSQNTQSSLKVSKQRDLSIAAKRSTVSSGQSPLKSSKAAQIKPLNNPNLQQQERPLTISEVQARLNRSYPRAEVILNPVTNARTQEVEHNLLNTSGRYGDIYKVSEKFNKLIKPEQVLIGRQKVAIDGEHATGVTLRRSYGITEDQGGAYFLARTIHNVHSKKMEASLPQSCGYLETDGTALDYMDYTKQQYLIILDEIFAPNLKKEFLLENNVKAIDFLSDKGVTTTEVRLAATRAFDVDINTLSNMDIEKTQILAFSHINGINKTVGNDFIGFKEKLDLGSSLHFTSNDASIVLTQALENFLDVQNHYHGASTVLTPGSQGALLATQSHKSALYSRNSAVKVYEIRGGVITPPLKPLIRQINSPNPSTVLDALAAEDLARDAFSYENPRRQIKSVFSHRYSIKNKLD